MVWHGRVSCPKFLGEVHPRRRTPHYAIVVLMAIVIALALIGDITRLALATSSLLLTVFIVVNAALLVLQRRPGEAKGQFEVPSIVPIGGVLVCSAMLISTLFDNDVGRPAIAPRCCGHRSALLRHTSEEHHRRPLAEAAE
jgi:amino acid transporter